MKKIIGIDLGTTNSVVAVADQPGARVLSDSHGPLIPSVVSFHPSGDVLVGASAKERRLLDAQNTVYSVKRLIGRPFTSYEVKQAQERFAFELSEGPSGGVLVSARGETYTLSEISAFVLRYVRKVAEEGLGLTCSAGDPGAFAERLIWAARHRDELRAMAGRGRDYVHEAFSYARTTRPMRAWAAAPYRAPDRGRRVTFEDIDFFRPPEDEPAAEVDEVGEVGEAEPGAAADDRGLELEARYRDVRGQLDDIHRSKMWRLWMAYLAVRRWLLRPFGER